MADNVRSYGFEADVNVVQAITPVAYTTSSTPIVSSAIDRRLYPRDRCMVIVSCKADATSTGVTPTVTECATSGGSYDPVTPSGTFAATNSAASQFASVKYNPAKPFMKVTATPAGGSGVVSATVVFLGEAI